MALVIQTVKLPWFSNSPLTLMERMSNAALTQMVTIPTTPKSTTSAGVGTLRRKRTISSLSCMTATLDANWRAPIFAPGKYLATSAYQVSGVRTMTLCQFRNQKMATLI